MWMILLSYFAGLLALLLFIYSPFRSVILYLWWKLKRDKNHSRGYIKFSDVKIYYEIYGSGQPLLLLHGGLTSVESWFAQLPYLSRNFKVYVIDMRGHGRSTIGSQIFTYELLANDVVHVMDHLDIAKVDIVGWSDGGNVGLRLAIDYPDRIRKLVAISSNYHPVGLTNNALKNIEASTPADHSFISRCIFKLVAPDPNTWNSLWKQVTTMWANYPQLTRLDLERIIAPTLLIQGENDLITKEHFLEMVESVPDAKMQIIPDVDHNVLQQKPKIIIDAIENFLQ